MIQAGILRDVITIQRPVLQQDAAGQQSTAYEDLHTEVRAAVVPLSGREYVTAQQVAAEVTTRITTRRYPSVVPTCRVLRTITEPDADGASVEVYDVLAVLPDPVSGLRYVNLMCAQRFAEGFRRGE